MRRRSVFSSISFDRWPALDRHLFDEARRPGDILEPGGPAATWRPKTVLWATENYGYWLHWLTQQGELDLEENPAQRCTVNRLSRFLTLLRENVAPATVASRIRALNRTLAVMCPDTDLCLLHGTVRRLDTRPAVDRRPRLRMADELLEYGHDLMSEAECLDDTAKRRAQRYRNGLIIAFLSYRPLRRSNFANLHLGVHLLHQDGAWRIHIPADETKTHHSIDDPMPMALVPYLEHYLSEYRLMLVPKTASCPGDTGPLWISSRTGCAMSGHTINLTVGSLTEQRFGKPMNLHMFREAAPTTLAIKAPQHVRIGATINNHADFSTTERAYNLANTMDAAEAHLETLTALRRKFRR